MNVNSDTVNVDNLNANGVTADNVDVIDVNTENANADYLDAVNVNTDNVNADDILADVVNANGVNTDDETTPKTKASIRTDNKCVTCYKRFPTAVQLRLHLVGARHKSVIKTEYQCSDCGKYFKVKYVYLYFKAFEYYKPKSN